MSCIHKGRPSVQFRPGKELSPWITANGYYAVAIKVGTVRKKFLVHRLVGWAFVPGYREGLSINHIDCNKLNNRADNLEWITLAENTAKQWRDGLVNLRGEANPQAKLTEEDVIHIRSSAASLSVMAKELSVSPTIISLIRRRKRWSHV